MCRRRQGEAVCTIENFSDGGQPRNRAKRNRADFGPGGGRGARGDSSAAQAVSRLAPRGDCADADRRIASGGGDAGAVWSVWELNLKLRELLKNKSHFNLVW